MLVISDIHFALDALRREVDRGELLLLLGDFVNLTDYRTGEGAIADVLGMEFARQAGDARAGGDFKAMRRLWEQAAGDRSDDVRSAIRSSIADQYGLVSAALMDLITVSDLAYLVVYFFMAYFMIASIMAAVGSAVTDIREANTLIMPVMFVVMIPLILWMPISKAPNGGLATSFSYIPPAIPFVMILRIAADEPVPLWQIPVTIVWGYACVLAMVWMSAKIFRVGVLMYGKPPSPLQLIKWLRYA